MKNILITGTAQGLGLELVKVCLKKGYTVFALSRRVSEELNLLECDKLHTYACDITDYEGLQKVKMDIQKYADSIDFIFNNAGVWLDKERLLLEDSRFDFDLFTKQYEINAVGAMKVVKTFVDMVLASTGKCIVNLSSEAGSITNALRVCEYGYCMSKAALNMGTKLLQNAYPNIKFYTIHPGWMKTSQGYAGATELYSPEQEPSDTARKLLTIAETKKYNFLYGDFEGNEMTW